MKLRQNMIRASWGLGITVLSLTIVLVLWFYSRWRSTAVTAFKKSQAAGKSALWNFVYQPDAKKDAAWTLQSQPLALEEKYDLDKIVKAVLAKISMPGKLPAAH